MNPHNPPPPDDDELAHEERELAALYRHLPQAEPDAALDAAVLSEASRAVAPPKRHPLPRWMVALSSAAVLVLAAGLVWRLEFAQQQAPVEAPAALQQAQPDALDDTTTQDMAPPAEPAAAPASGRASQPAMARRAPAAAPALPAPQVRQERERQAPAITPQVKALAVPPAKRAASAPPRIAPPPAVDEASSMPVPPLPAPPLPIPPPPMPSKPLTAASQEHPATMATAYTADMAQPADGTTATASTVGARGEAAATPPAFTQRVEQIRQTLRQGGSRNEARKSVHALQHDFPGVVLPDDLRALNDEHP